MNLPFICLIDDDRDWLFLSKAHLRKAGVVTHPFAEARDGGEAISLLDALLQKGEAPLFVLLDINMPRIGGFEVLQWIRAEPRLAEVPVIMLSSSQLSADIFRARVLGADAFLAKGDNVACFRALYAEAKEFRVGGSKPANALHALPGNLLSPSAFEFE